MKNLAKLLLLVLLIMPTLVSVADTGKMLAFAEEDEDVVEDDDEAVVTEGVVAETESEEPSEEEGEAGRTQGSSDVDTVILFTQPSGKGEELPAGKLTEFLVGFTNNGDSDFVLASIEASFRYPMDFSFYIQNFSAIPFNRAVKPKQEATVLYSFYPAEAFAGRPLGLTVNLAYHDSEGQTFTEAVFNQTVNIIEVDEGLDGETFFLYVFMLAFAVLLLLAGHHVLSSFGKKEPKKVVPKSTTVNGIDFDWIPEERASMNKRAQQQTSPRQRRTRS